MTEYRRLKLHLFLIMIVMTASFLSVRAQTDGGLAEATSTTQSASSSISPLANPALQPSRSAADESAPALRTVPSATAMATTTSTPPTASLQPVSSSPHTSVVANEVLITPAAPTNESASENSGLLMVGIISLVALGVGVWGLKLKSNSKKKEKKEEQKCDSIKALLEQKKKEVEEMIRNWPEEKIKRMAKDEILKELKKDEDIEKILERAENLKGAYDKLQKAIEILQKKYDLCMLSFPTKETAPYRGTIIENSLNDKTMLESLKITRSYKIQDWSLNDVVVQEKQIEKLGEYLNDGPWYMHFWQPDNDNVIVIFKDKMFKIKYSDKTTWKEAIEYGKSKGIPEEQLDFVIQDKEYRL